MQFFVDSMQDKAELHEEKGCQFYTQCSLLAPTLNRSKFGILPSTIWALLFKVIKQSVVICRTSLHSPLGVNIVVHMASPLFGRATPEDTITVLDITIIRLKRINADHTPSGCSSRYPQCPSPSLRRRRSKDRDAQYVGHDCESYVHKMLPSDDLH